jgi:hypothetical protein
MTAEETAIVQEALDGIVEDIRRNLADTNTNASGRTSASLEVVMRTDGGSVLGRPYFQSVEKGRPPGPVPYNFRSIIRQWMADKGIAAPAIPYIRQPSERWQPKYTPEERGAMAMAGAIAHTIKERGTLLYREGGRTDIYTDVLDRRLAEMGEKLSLKILKRL